MQNQQLAVPTPLTKPSALAIMGSRFNVDPAKLNSTLKNTVFKGASDEEMLALVVVANEYGLNPLTKEIYAFPAKGGGIVPVVSVDGWNNMANSHPQMDGMEFEFDHAANGSLVSCTCIVYRKDRSRPIRVTEYLSECRRSTDPWKMEHRMLRHKALIQCVRIAFGFSGVHDDDEAREITNVTVYDVEPVRSAVVPNNSPSAVGAAGSGVPAGDTSTAAGRVPRTRQPQPEPQREDMVMDAIPALTPSEQILANGHRDGITWNEVAESAVRNGLLDEPCAIGDADVAALRELLGVWPSVVADVKGGQQ
jgi:phage recombination protein Bet